MPRYGRFDAIYFFETSGGVLRGGGARHVPELEKYEARYKTLDRKSRFFYGNVPPTDIFQIKAFTVGGGAISLGPVHGLNLSEIA